MPCPYSMFRMPELDRGCNFLGRGHEKRGFNGKGKVDDLNRLG
jgi:hypothetical protein